MITQAAIKKDGQVYTGQRHHEIINSHASGFFRGAEQGFVTSDGCFVSREEAALIAYECGQIQQPKKKLFSEDLY